MSGCGIEAEKRKVSKLLQSYLKPELTDNMTFNLTGFSNRRDTIILDFDPIDYAEEKIHEAFKEKSERS